MLNTARKQALHKNSGAREDGTLKPAIAARLSRPSEMARCPQAELKQKMSHHAGKAYCGASVFFARGGPDYVPGTDDTSELAKIFLERPEIWLARLDAVFVGVERSYSGADSFRARYARLSEQYYTRMLGAILISGPDVDLRYRLCSDAARDIAPEFGGFFDSLRAFIGYSACRGSKWRTGDTEREKWDKKFRPLR